MILRKGTSGDSVKAVKCRWLPRFQTMYDSCSVFRSQYLGFAVLRISLHSPAFWATSFLVCLFPFILTAFLVLIFSSFARSLLSYAGPLTYRGEVAPLDVRVINASAWASRHGTYDVGKWELEITGSNGQSWRRSGQGREVRVGQKNT